MVEGKYYHKGCFKCSYCKVTLKPGNYTAIDGKTYCKPHFIQLFKAGGKYDFDPSLLSN